MEILRKITIRNVGWTKAAINAELSKHYDGITKSIPEGTSVDLLKVVGSTTQAKTGQTDTGEYCKLLGEFIATNMQTGEVFQSSSAILPNFVAEAFAAALHTSQSVEFALQINAVAKADSATGYEFAVKPLMESEPTDKMQRLLKLAGIDPKAQPKLPAPSAQTDAGKAAQTDAGKAAKGKAATK